MGEKGYDPNKKMYSVNTITQNQSSLDDILVLHVEFHLVLRVYRHNYSLYLIDFRKLSTTQCTCNYSIHSKQILISSSAAKCLQPL